jgi:hypothetical protein
MTEIPQRERAFLLPYAERMAFIDGGYTGTSEERRSAFEDTVENELSQIYGALSSKNSTSFKPLRKLHLDDLTTDEGNTLLVGVHNCSLPKEIMAYFTAAEQLAVYSSIGKAKKQGHIVSKKKNITLEELQNMSAADAYSTLVSASWEKNPNFYNKINLKTDGTQSSGSLKKRIKGMNFYQQKRLKYELTLLYIGSIQEGNSSGWYDPNCDGNSKKAVLSSLKNVMF